MDINKPLLLLQSLKPRNEMAFSGCPAGPQHGLWLLTSGCSSPPVRLQFSLFHSAQTFSFSPVSPPHTVESLPGVGEPLAIFHQPLPYGSKQASGPCLGYLQRLLK